MPNRQAMCEAMTGASGPTAAKVSAIERSVMWVMSTSTRSRTSARAAAVPSSVSPTLGWGKISL